ncbi:MAG TPA: hypothetical protein VJT73_05495 [Polyangiaceae bacterium]|nr:hypothetical protein [Polyangiaceae bacterium]
MPARSSIVATVVVGFATIAGGLGACRAKSAAPSGSHADGAASASSVASATPYVLPEKPLVDAGPMASGIPVPAAKVDAIVNPAHEEPYRGPTGTIEGIIKVSGDPPPKANPTIPFECGEAYATYGKAFREGTGHELADVLVAVTGYRGYLPVSNEVVSVGIHGCAYESRTVAVTYGQRIEVSNRDARESFVPTLLGAELPAQIIAVPRGDAVKLYPVQVGHFALADGMKRDWMYSDVFVLRYPTHAVTALDGRYRITGIPAGKVKVSAYSPQMDEQLHPDTGVATSNVEREVEVKAGETTNVDFVIHYKTPKPKPKPKPLPPSDVVR